MKKVLLALVLFAVASAGCHIIGPPSDLVAFDAHGAQVTVALVGEPVVFTCSGTDPFRIHLYMWDFGDGTVTEWDKIKIEHTYKQPGTYEVQAMERCPLIFGETCLMRTEWSPSFKITITEPAASGPWDTARTSEGGSDSAPSLGRTSGQD